MSVDVFDLLPISPEELANFSWYTQGADYSMTAADSGIGIDASSGDVTITLPDAAATAQLFAVKRIDDTTGGHNAVANTTRGQTIEGAAQLALLAQGEVYVVGSDGSNWRIVASYYPSPLTTEGDLLYLHNNVAARLALGTGLSIAAGALNAAGTLELTDGTHDLSAVTKITVSGAVVGGTSSAATVAIPATPSSPLVLLPNPYNFVSDTGADYGQPPDFITTAAGDVIGVGGM